MNQKEFKSIQNFILSESKKIMDAKQPEYTNKNTDVLHNFKTTAENVGIKPMQVWAVFLNKHIQSILSHAGDPKMKQAEPIHSRYADAINYLFLGLALIKETNHHDIPNILDE